MADQIDYYRRQRNGQRVPFDDQPGLEAAHSDAPILDAPLPEVLQTPGTEPKSGQHSGHSVAPQPPTPQSEKRRILGLTVPVFWGIVVSLVVILAAGIAGGVAGGLAAQKSNTSPDSPSSTSTVPSPTSTAPSPSGTLPAPTDGGCPQINQTTYTPTDAEGKTFTSSGTSQQSFRQLCEVNYPSGAAWGNPDVYDILQTYVSTFEECMTLCAAYNRAYAANLARAAVVGSEGFCRSVAMIKLPGQYCYLKNGTGKSDTQGHPEDFVSAVLLTVVTGL
ncbi:hypothetical protein CTRI78_v002392 [Colletotrichum trifolii]|uniref:Apple domain-containing protein n=1 Tax=Colletotrichum trifolii TaxID=5466 RepID=A0A4R8RM14_COLTR|nr:hypothetical protein CTRI78_v002392 [Colletotrichum trifolii]